MSPIAATPVVEAELTNEVANLAASTAALVAKPRRKSPNKTPAEVREEVKKQIFSIESDDLRKSVLVVIKEQALAVAARQTRQDAKATGMFGSVGLSLTVVAFSLASRDNLLVGHPWAIGLVGLATLVGLVAAGCALRALQIKSVSILDRTEVLDKDVLQVAADSPGDYEKWIAYRTWMTVESMLTVQKDRGAWIARAQALFLVFIGLVLLLVMMFAYRGILG